MKDFNIDPNFNVNLESIGQSDKKMDVLDTKSNLIYL